MSILLILSFFFYHQAPITLHGLEGRYATAIYTAAARQNSLDAVEKDLSAFAQAIKKDEAFKSFLENPTVPRATKLSGLNSVVKKSNELTTNLLDVLAENGRLSTLDKVIGAYGELMSAHRNELPLVVTSAKVGPLFFMKNSVEQYTFTYSPWKKPP